ncbi:TetR family transcriptional regulator [Luteibacter flocculans]|uniref:TetR family transcriptional regulator n=1 Tax=Luteibacter flocculans TaxID=2780091 RepID=A0ABY4T0C9_9GAMM|nr:TetR/AcrR family transcriptional regulator [Luteibacter flocculans]URL58403.1 TetR family transcriptional regulator [Luteibacter flocculans]
MSKKPARAGRRTEALTKAQIVEAAIAILDSEGVAALTFRTLSTRLATGSGAIYWHIANKEELLGAATDHIVAAAMDAAKVPNRKPREAIRAIATAVFDAFDAHPWIGGQLSLAPGRTGMLQVFEAIGGRLVALGVPAKDRFDVWSALVNYIFGVAAQNADNARRAEEGRTREDMLGTLAEAWGQLDASQFPFLHEVAVQLPGHDDREQFLAGIDLILDGALERRP